MATRKKSKKKTPARNKPVRKVAPKKRKPAPKKKAAPKKKKAAKKVIKKATARKAVVKKKAVKKTVKKVVKKTAPKKKVVKKVIKKAVKKIQPKKVAVSKPVKKATTKPAAKKPVAKIKAPAPVAPVIPVEKTEIVAAPPAVEIASTPAASGEGHPLEVHITFFSGVGQITATLVKDNGNEVKSTNHSGTLVFENAKRGDELSINGASSGTATLTTNRDTSPASGALSPRHYPEGPIFDSLGINE